ncbi:MAG: TonB family protein [Phenylobacterium sp.]|uniref:TonB family protein n=1 Tax=Phenylobacterium sp. TaxID=1871053 RepID=UPI003BB7F064
MSRLKGLGLALAISAAMPSAALAADTIVHATWLTRPNAEDLRGVWPAEALKRGKGGKAVLSCTVTTTGALVECLVVSETPAGSGFGQAAISLTPQFVMSPATRNGVPFNEAGVKVAINFDGAGPETGSRIGGQMSMAPLPGRAISDVPWIVAPTYDQVVAAYPQKARDKAVAGRVVMSCVFKSDGHLTGCSTVREEPGGYGFSGAARSLVAHFAAPITLGGSPVRAATTLLAVAFEPKMLDPSHPPVGKPQWTVLPEAADFQAGYPQAALAANVLKGRAVVSCTVAAEGRLTDCAVASEEPAGLGFGAAASAMTPAFRMGIWTPDGLPTVGARIKAPIRYERSEAAAPKL